MADLSGRARQLARNALTGAGRYAVGAALALAVTPFALGRLGEARFGIWALAGALLALIRLLDLGLNRALTHRVATARGEGRSARTAAATARAMAIGLGGGAVAAVAWAAGPLAGQILRIPAELRDEAVYVLVGTACVAAVEGAFAPNSAALDGLGRMDLTNIVDTLVQRILSPLGVVVALGMGWGLPGLVWKNLATAGLAGALYLALLRREAPDLARPLVAWDGASARDLLAYGRHIQAVALLSAMIEPFNKALLSRHAGLDAVAIYELATRVASQLSGVFLALAATLFPAAAELRAAAGSPGAATGRDAAVLALYRRAARYHAWLVWPAYTLMIGLAGAFVTAWLGPGFDRLAPAIRLLAVGWGVAILSLPAFLVAQAAGRARLSTIGALVTAATAIAAAAMLARPAGLGGVVAGLSLGLAAGALVMLVLFKRAFRLSARDLGAGQGRAAIAAALGGAAAWGAAGALPGSLVTVGLAGLFGLAVYAAAMHATGALDSADRALLRGLLGWGASGGRSA